MKWFSNSYILGITVLVLGSLSACTPPEERQPQTQSQSEPKLLELQQLKQEQIAQVDVDLEKIRAEMQDIESELAQPVEMKALHNMTAEEITASFRRSGLEARLAELKEQEAELAIRKQGLEEDLEMIDLILEGN